MALTYMVLKTNIMNKLKTIQCSICLVGVRHMAYGIAQEESHS